MTIQTSLRALSILLLLASNGFASPEKKRADIPVSAGIFGSDRYFHEFSEVRKLFPTGTSSVPGGWLRKTRETLDTINVPTRILDVDWDPVEGAWMNSLDVTMVYDTFGREIERTINAGMFNFWMPQANLLWTYDANGHVTRVISRIWVGGSWQTNSRDTVIYDLSGLPIEERVELFNGSGWDPYQRYVISHDPQRRPVEVIAQGWGGSGWFNSSRYALSYDGAGRETEFLNQTWAGSAWTNSSRETFTWDVNGNRTVELDQFWTSGDWFNDNRYTWTYDGSNLLIEEVFAQWGTSDWINDTREEYTNSMEGYPEQTLRQLWNGLDWTDDKIIYAAYDRSMLVEELTMTWNGSTWVNFHQTSWSWQTFVTPTVTRQFAMIDKWNMVSVPLDVADHAKAAVFPTSVGNAFFFDAGYSPASTLENGRGYWLKFDGAQNVSVTGLPVSADTFDVTAGWNMIGSIGVPVAAASVGSIPGGLVSSDFFAFNNGYVNATTIEPGKGYWVKIAQAGQLVLSGSGNTPVASRLRMELQGEMPPAPPSDGDVTGTAPSAYALEQNYPNPFNPVTTIRYSLPTAGRVVVSVFNMVGQEVARLVDGMEDAGEKSVSFDASKLPSGVYTCRITAGSFTDTKKMVLLK